MDDGCACKEHDRKDVTLPDGFQYHYHQCRQCARIEYPLAQAQALLEYSRSHVFMFVEDWVLAWLRVSEPFPANTVSEAGALQGPMVVIWREFAPEHGIASEDPGFMAHRFGPYAGRIDRALESLTDLGCIGGACGPSLTDTGRERADAILSKIGPEASDDLRSLASVVCNHMPQGLGLYLLKKYP